MEKNGLSILFGILLVFSMALSLVSAETITVCSGGCNYTSIQDAVNNAASGDTVSVSSGAYYENVVVDEEIVLEGYDATISVSDGIAVEIKADDVTIDGFVIKHSSVDDLNDMGIRISLYDRATIKNNKIESNSIGLYLQDSGHNEILNNEFDGDVIGIYFEGTTDGTHSDGGDNGPFYSLSLSNNVDGNTIKNSQALGGQGGDGIYLDAACESNIFNDNTIINNDANGIYFWKADNNIVTKNIISDNGDNGIQLMGSSGNKINENTLDDNTNYGIWLRSGALSSTSNEIKENEISNNKVGIKLDDDYSSNNYIGIVTGNVITQNNVFDNNDGVVAEDLSPSTSIDAEDNYWGNEFGASSSNNTGYGDSVTDNVDACPYLDAEDGTSIACYLDTDGPVISSLAIAKVFGFCAINVDALASDLRSIVTEAEYYMGSCGEAGTGIPMGASDKEFDSLVEEIYVYNIFVSDGRPSVYVRAKDELGQWGNCVQIDIDIDCDVPSYPVCDSDDAFGDTTGIMINGECNANEKLVCDIDPTISAYVCDVESTIQLAEYFIDEDCEISGNCLNWNGIEMSAEDGQYFDEHCELVTAVVDLDNLDDNTHVVRLHGKDSQENWGKFDESSPEVSFIKDTTSPETKKVLSPADDINVSCFANENSLVPQFLDNEDIEEFMIDPCTYVKQGTSITLDARDYNPDEDDDQLELGAGYNNLEGEYAGDVTIHYIVWWSEDGNSWENKKNGTSLIDSPITFTLDEDSYHLIEYWSTDGTCENEEVHHFELDIVDTAEPISSSSINGPYFYNETEDKTYVDTVTKINVSCDDQQPHPVEGEVIKYMMYNDKGESIQWDETESSYIEIGFAEGNWTLEYYCIDALNNRETTHSEVYYSDHTKPVTSISYGDPFDRSQVTGTTDFPKYINSSSEITLTANDYFGEVSDSGLNYTEYRITKIPDSYCMTPASGCTTYNDKYDMDDNDWNTETESEFSFTIDETSCHLIEWYSVDNVNKTETLNEDCVFVDNEAPISEYEITGPVFNDTVNDKVYIDNASRLVLSCQDNTSIYTEVRHASEADEIYYKVDYSNGTELVPWGEYDSQSDSIWFPEESHHVVSYYCVDVLGNAEEVETLDLYVDHSKPNTNLSFGKPYYSNGTSEWISQDTTITLTSGDDYGADHDSGVNETYYRWMRVDDDYCYGNIPLDTFVVAPSDESDDSPVIHVYDGAFKINEDSCHAIEYWSVDKVEKEEGHNVKYVFVESDAPDSEKTLDYSYEIMPNGEAQYVNMGEDGIFVWKGDDSVWHMRWTTNWDANGEWNNVVGTVYTGDDGVFSDFSEYSFEGTTGTHPDLSTFDEKKITVDSWVDGGEDGIDFKYSGDYLTFDFSYDGEENESLIFVGQDRINPVSVPFTLPFTYVTQDTNVTLSCDDRNNHPVGEDDIQYRIWYKELADGSWQEGSWTEYSEPFTFSEDSYHMIEFYCTDLLGNEEEHRFEVDYVDSQAPTTTKTVGTPKVACDPDTEDCHYWITNETEITLSCDDLGEHPVGESYIEYRWFKDGVLSQDWNTYSEPFTFDDGDSNHTLEYKCTDLLGNEEIAQVEYDRVDTEAPEIEKWVSDDTVQSGVEVEICANITDYKANGDSGVGVDASSVFAHLTNGNKVYSLELAEDSEADAYCGTWTAPDTKDCKHKCYSTYCEYRCDWGLTVEAADELGNWNEENGIHIIVDNADPIVEYVLNPTNGQYYRTGKLFSVYAPAIDFGGDENVYNSDGCEASDVDYCEFFAVDYPWENVNQSEVQNYWDLLNELDDVFDNPAVYSLGQVSYEDGVCKGTLEMPEGPSDKAFLAYRIVDNAGNVNGGSETLATDFNGDYIIMDIDNEGPVVSITDLGNTPGPLTSTQSIIGLTAEIVDPDSGFDSCYADVYFANGTDTGLNIKGENVGDDVCEIVGEIPAYGNIYSGNYELRINAVDEIGNLAYDWTSLIIDNDRPTMSVITPLKSRVYSEMFPVSLNVQDVDYQSAIAVDTVKFKIREVGLFGSGICLFSKCEDTGWITLTEQSNGLFADTINLTYYNISGESRYVLDAIACDDLYVADNKKDMGFDSNLDRNAMHCIILSEEESVPEEVRTSCNDGIDNDGDGYIDYSNDEECSSYEDDDEAVVEIDACDVDGDGYLAQGETCGGTDCNDNNPDSWRTGWFWHDGDGDSFFEDGFNRRESDGMMSVCYGTLEGVFESGYTDSTSGEDCNDDDASITNECYNDDTDGDGVADIMDNCVYVANAGQEDADGDRVGDVCDNCPVNSNSYQKDSDGDGVGGACDCNDGDAQITSECVNS